MHAGKVTHAPVYLENLTILTANAAVDFLYVCSAVKSMTNSSMYFKNIDSLLRQTISMKEQISNSQGRRYEAAFILLSSFIHLYIDQMGTLICTGLWLFSMESYL